MLQQNTPHLLDDHGMTLTRVTASHNDLGFNIINVCAFVFNNTVIAFDGIAVALYRNNGMPLYSSSKGVSASASNGGLSGACAPIRSVSTTIAALSGTSVAW